MLIRETDRLWACGIFDILGQATADDAFRDFSSIKEVLALKANPKGLRRIHWKEERLEEYVLRNSDGKPLTDQTYGHLLRRHVKAEGYRRITSYSIRRFVSNQLARRSAILISGANNGRSCKNTGTDSSDGALRHRPNIFYLL
jgi:hypothetical protein